MCHILRVWMNHYVDIFQINTQLGILGITYKAWKQRKLLTWHYSNLTLTDFRLVLDLSRLRFTKTQTQSSLKVDMDLSQLTWYLTRFELDLDLSLLRFIKTQTWFWLVSMTWDFIWLVSPDLRLDLDMSPLTWTNKIRIWLKLVLTDLHLTSTCANWLNKTLTWFWLGSLTWTSLILFDAWLVLNLTWTCPDQLETCLDWRDSLRDSNLS